MADETLFEMPESRVAESAASTRREEARLLQPCREQMEWAPRSLDAAIGEDHPVRAIWALLERLDLSAFYTSIKAVLGRPGHPATDPRVLLGLWLYATAEGVGSARQLARLCEEHDAYRWLLGGVPTNYHTLSDFRVAHQEALDELLTKVLASMMVEGLVTLRHVAQDGMRTRASAGASSFRRKGTLEGCLTEARKQVERLAEEREHPDPGVSRREQAARERGAREREARVGEALRRLPAVEAVKERQSKALAKAKREKVTEPRVSTTDPDAHVMKMPDGGFRPAFNLEVASDVDSQVIVGVGVVTTGSDGGQALPMAEQVQKRTGVNPEAYLVDGGFASRGDITALEQKDIVVYAPTRLPRTTTSGRTQADPRPDDTPEVANWRQRMQTEEAKKVYKERAATAECVNAHLRRYDVRQLPVRGTAKVLSVLLLAAIAHNLLRWIALTGALIEGA
jgi:transposase